MSRTIVLGMSGGVDSSVSAYLLREMGYKVIGVTFMLWGYGLSDEHDKRLDRNIADAKSVADKLSIEHRVLDLSQEFSDLIMMYFVDEYSKGRTPNPCVECNKHIKFGLFLEKALEMGAEKIATGHYANIEYDYPTNRYMLNKSNAEGKDQTYFLYKLSQDQLSKIVFPLNSFAKSQVRQIALDQGLAVASKKDSQEICFIPKDDYKAFIQDRLETIAKGEFVDIKGNVLGEHSGIINYTVGQRKGLGIAFGKPTYVISIDIKKNRVTLGDDNDLFVNEIFAKDVNYIPFDYLTSKLDIMAKIRYNAKEVPATIYPLGDNRVKIVFNQNVRAITPGQSVVFYDDKYIIGGGIIE